MRKELGRRLSKFLSIVATVSLLLNSWAPVLLAPGVVFAESATPTPEATIAPTEAPTDSPSITSETTDPTVSPDPSLTPTPQVTATPEVLLPTPTPDNSEPPVLSGEVLVQANDVSPQTTTGPPQLDLGQQESEPSAQLNYSLSTDKADYSPSDTVTITGSNFPTNSNLTVRVTWPDGQVRDAEGNIGSSDTVTTDQNGSFIYLYPLRGEGQQGSYLVEVLLGASVLATTTFTDSTIPDNKVAISMFGFVLSGVYSLVSGQPTGTGELKNGNVGAYPEGACIPTEIEVKNNDNTDGDIIVSPVYDFQNSVIGIDHLEQITTGLSGNPRSSADNLNDFSYPGSDFTSSTSFVKSSGGTVPATVSGPFGGNNDGTTPISSSDSLRHYNVILSNVPSHNTVYMLFCGRLGLDASQFNGSSMSIRTAQGGQENIPIPVNQLLQLPSITLSKIVDSGSATSDQWSFTITPAINGQSVYPIPPGQNSVTINNVSPDGNYTVTESGPAGYTFASGTGTSCTFNGSTATATVAAGKPPTNATCTFHNALNTGTIIVHKDVQGPNGEAITDTSQNFTVRLDSANPQFLTDGETFTYTDITAGTHTITEDTPPTGYALFSITPDNDGGTSGAQVTVTPGQTTDVFVVNRQQNATITVIKDVLNPDGGEVSDTHQFTVNVGSQSDQIGEGDNGVFTVVPGTYAITESPDPDYDLVSITPDEDTGAGGTQVVVGPGEQQTVNVVNKQKKATINVVKDVRAPDGSDVSDNHAFTAQLNGANNQSFSETLTASYPVNPGSYSITEVEDSNYTYVSCTPDANQTPGDGAQVTVSSNGTITVTCTNKQKNAIVTIVKDVRDPNGNDVLDSTNFVVQRGGGDNKDFHEGLNAVYTLAPGTYTFSEIVTAGYTLNNINPDNDTNASNGTTQTLASNQNLIITFVNYQNVGSISGFKFEDTDGSLLTSGDQTGLIGWAIELWSCASDFTGCVLSQTINTASDGSYSFSSIIPGYYQVKEVLQAGWTALTAVFKNVTLTPGGSVTEQNFINFKNVSVKACKVIDADGDIGTTGDQTNKSGWTVKLLVDSQVSDTQTTEEDGCYTWTNLGPGHTYGVSEETPGGWTNLGDTTHSFGQATSGSNYVFTFVNFQNAQIIVHKNVLGTDGTTDVSNSTEFTSLLNGGTPKAIAEGTDATYPDLGPGTYTITEATAPTGYQLVSISDGGVVTVSSGGTFNVYVTNKQVSAQLIVIKHVINNNGGDNVASDFNINVTGTNVSDSSFQGDENGTTVTLDAGSYSVDEDSVSGYTKSLSQDCSGTIAFGQTKTCTITNNDVGPTVTLIKNVINDNGGNAGVNNFGLTIGGVPVTSGQTIEVDANTSVAINEAGLTGYEFVSIAGEGCPTQLGGTVTLDEGESVTCTITNDDIAPSITLIKEVINDNGGNAGSDDFGISVGGSAVLSGATTTVSANTPIVINEVGLTGYSFVSISGDAKCPEILGGTVTLDEGESITCTITNNDVGPTITLTKVVVNNNGGNAQPNDFDPTIDGNVVLSGSTTQVSANQPHTINETVLDGYNFVSITGDAKCPNTLGGTVTLDEGENISCTITNDDIIPTITLIKEVIGGNADPDDFGLLVDDIGVLSGFATEVDANTPIAIDEDGLEGYSFTSITGDEKCPEVLGGTVILDEGEDVTCTITNTRDIGEIVVNKQVDTNGDGSFEGDNDVANELGFRWGIDEETPEREMGESAGPLDTGTYDVSENNVLGYHFVGWFEGEGTCEDPENAELPASITVEEDQSAEITLCNARDTGDLTVLKNVDANGDGDLNDEEDIIGATNWTWDIAGVEQNIATGQTRTLPTESYTISEDLQEEFGLVSWSCSDETSGTTNEIVVNLTTDGVTCTFTNQKLLPGISLTKTNDHTSSASGSDVVTYTLVITNTGGGTLHDVRLVDVLPSGFTFIPLTGTPADPDSVSGNILTWNNLGDIAGTASLTVTYKAVIASDIHAGTHTNLAFAQGTGSDTFQSNIVRSSVPIGKGVFISYDIHQPQVLAAVTELPAAGANTVWLVYVGFLLGAGFGLRRLGLALAPRRKGRAKKSGLWKKFLGSVVVLLLFIFVAQVSPAKAAVTVDILDLPSYTNTDTFYISYTALDIEGDSVTANFFVKKDGGTFRSLVNSSTTGATNKVLVTGADFYDGQGKYIFRVEVTGGADTSADETNTNFDHSGPSGVQEYRKERPSDSSYRLFWKNPGDSDFSRVFIYRSDKPEFTADGGTKVGEVGGAPDQQMSWDNFGLESGKTYFYALRAVDHAGNGSGIVADQEAQVTAGAVLASAATTTGAVAGGVGEVKILPKEEPSEGEILGGEATPTPSAAPTPVGEEQGGLLERLSGNRLLALGVILIVVIGALVFWPRRPRE